jgi:hypothetical protein
LAQFFYVGSHVLLFLFPIWTAIMVGLDRSRLRLWISGAAVLMLSAFATVLPLAVYFIRHPQEFLAPMSRVGIFGPWWILQTVNYGDPAWLVMAEQTSKPSARRRAPHQFCDGQPILNPPLLPCSDRPGGAVRRRRA